MLRRYAVPMSIVVHACLLSVIVATPFFASHALPSPVMPLVFAAPAALYPVEPPPPVSPATPTDTPRPSPLAAPTESPAALTPEPANVPVPGWRIGGVDGGLPAVAGSGVRIAEPPAMTPTPATPLEPFRVGGQIREPRKIKNVNAVYPAIAVTARVSGAVVLDAVIGEDGRVRDVTIRTSVPLLNRAAIDAVRQWVFTPTTLNGVAVPVIMTVTVTFTLK